MNAYDVLDIPVTATREQIREAYRSMARRWHPDHFTPGPEQDSANARMADINAAYRMCLNGLSDPRQAAENEDEALRNIQKLIDAGQYSTARKQLMGFSTRCAEWNYLFGEVLMEQRQMDKALIYLTVAVHQEPASIKYARALKQAQRRNSAINRLVAALGRRLHG